MTFQFQSPALQLIPVLDLMGGQVVRARAGRRDEYRPLESRLCASSRPEAVVEGLLALYPFPVLYVADLDAILDRGDHDAVLEGLRRRFPDLGLWLDRGFASPAEAGDWQKRGLGRAVLGSESLNEIPEAGTMPPGGILSLDFRASGFVGPGGLEQAPARWPADVILMTLGRVGMGGGPDLDLLARYRGLAPEIRFHAAGGVRHAGDLEALAAAGASGVLLASALHDGHLSREALAAFHPTPIPAPAPGATASGPGPDR